MKLKKFIATLLVVALLVVSVPLNVISAFAITSPKLSIKDVYAASGTEVSVDIVVENNPGILGMTLKLNYDEEFATLISVKNGETLNYMTFTAPLRMQSGCNLQWDAEFVNENNIKDGVIATLTFRISENAPANKEINVSVSFDNGAIIDNDLNPIAFSLNSGVIKVLDYMPGDLNNDGLINSTDVVYLRRYIAGYDVNITEDAGDVNDDGIWNSTDVVYIRRYIAGYDVKLKPHTPKCKHVDMTHTPAKEATCTEVGNIEYWYCAECDKYFSDAEGRNEVTLENTVLAITHIAVVDPAVEATHETTGLTEGSHCALCKQVLVPQEIIPVLTYEYSIKYNIAGSDAYLATFAINNSNPVGYDSKNGVSSLEDLDSPDGYTFLGWYDASQASSDAKRIRNIPENTKGNYTLYAHWGKVQYTIQYDIGFNNIDPNLISIKETDYNYTVDQGKLLPVAKLDGYIFVGWSDGTGDIIKQISVGTTGNKVYTANWVSERNLAYSKKTLDDPLIYEDENLILFTYEIGEIRNVPLYTLVDFGKINSTGVDVTKEYEHTTTISKTHMEAFTDFLSKATVESFGWTLSNEWSHSTTVNEEWAEEHGLTVEEAQEICKNQSNEWYISSGFSGTDTTEIIDTTDTYDLHTTTKNTKTYNVKDEETRQDYSVGLNSSTKLSLGLSGKLGAEVEGGGDTLSGELGATGGIEKQIGVDFKYSKGVTTNIKTGTEVDEGSSDQTGSVTHSGTVTTSENSWNFDSGMSGSSSFSKTDTVAKTVSSLINEKYGYGESYLDSENKTQDQQFATENTSSKEYSSTVTYGTSESTTEKTVYTLNNTVSGYHRIVMAGTAHVFAVVGYDIKTGSYFVSSYTVMDDEQHQFQDYSCDYASYNDMQSSIIEFVAPADIADYVATRVNCSAGLEVSKAGMITAYNGTDTYVIIPEYTVIANNDGTKSVVKITGISKNAFSGNKKVEVIELSDFVTEIPDEAFKDCTALISFEGDGITSIGANAFTGCSSLKSCSLGASVTTLGENAFGGMEDFAVNAANKSVVEAAVNSGAQNIMVVLSDACTDLSDMVINIPKGTNSFTLNGYEKILNDVYIVSDALKTIINRVTLNAHTGQTPLKLSSSEIYLQEVTVDAEGFALISSAETANIYLYGESYLNSVKENAVLSKNVILNKLGEGYYSQLYVNNNIMACGDFAIDYLTLEEGKIINEIDLNTFEKYFNGVVNICFDANGGSVSQTTKEAYYGEAVGELPTPTRDYYTFDGWYTEAEGGEEVTADTVMDKVGDITIYAHWHLNDIVEVLASEVPEDAQFISERWTYDLTEEMQSKESFVEGWTQTSWKWEEVGNGTHYYANYPEGYDSSNELYHKYNKSALSAYENSTNKREIASTTLNSYIYYHWARVNSSTESSSHNRTIEPKYTPSSGYIYFYTFESATNYPFHAEAGNLWKADTGRGSYWWYRFEVYTQNYVDYEKLYTHTKVTTNIESDVEVTESESISNIKKWVQYRAK